MVNLIVSKKLLLKFGDSKGGKPRFGKIKLRQDEISKLYPNISKAKYLLKWRPKINLNHGLKRTIYYFKKTP